MKKNGIISGVIGSLLAVGMIVGIWIGVRQKAVAEFEWKSDIL